MRQQRYLLSAVAVVAILAAAPVQAASSALIIGLVAAGVIVTAVATASNQPHGSAWAYTDKHGWVAGAPEHVATVNAPLIPVAGTSARVVNACRDAIMRKAERYDLASLEAVSAGKQVRVKGRIVAPLEVRAIYKVRDVHEVRRTTVRCEVDRSGRVVATL